MSDVMNPLISMTPVIDLSLIDHAYVLNFDNHQYVSWNTGNRSDPDVKEMNEELIRKGVPNHLQCILKVY